MRRGGEAPKTMPRRELRFCRSADGTEIGVAIYGAPVPGTLPVVRVAAFVTHIEREIEWDGSLFQGLIGEFGRRGTYITFDQRGCGLSQRRVETVSTEAWVEDLEAVVDALALPLFVLFGNSVGAPVALAYAARHPERVASLILMGGFLSGYLSLALRDPRAVEEIETILKVVELGWGKGTAAFRQLLTTRWMPDASAEAGRAFDEMQRLACSPEVAVRIMREAYVFDVSAEATRVQAPTLVMHVRGDQMIPFKLGRRLAVSIPGARFEPIDGNNHIFGTDEPAWARFVELTREFLHVGEGAADVPATRAQLTARQRDVLAEVAQGKTDKEVARALALSPRTVEMHVAAALKALGAKTRAEAVRLATEQGLLPASPP